MHSNSLKRCSVGSVSVCLNVSQRDAVGDLFVVVSLRCFWNNVGVGNRTTCEIVGPSLMCLLMKGLRAVVPLWKEEIVLSDKVWKKSQCKNRESEGQPECLISLRAEEDTHREDSCPWHKIYDIRDYQKHLRCFSHHTRILILFFWSSFHDYDFCSNPEILRKARCHHSGVDFS